MEQCDTIWNFDRISFLLPLFIQLLERLYLWLISLLYFYLSLRLYYPCDKVTTEVSKIVDTLFVTWRVCLSISNFCMAKDSVYMDNDHDTGTFLKSVQTVISFNTPFYLLRFTVKNTLRCILTLFFKVEYLNNFLSSTTPYFSWLVFRTSYDVRVLYPRGPCL